MGAFIEAQNSKTRIAVIVLSDSQGRYRIPDLPAGDYHLQIRSVGFRAEPRSGVTLAADQNASFDFALQKGVVRWNEISYYQAKQLWPAAKGKDLILEHCYICHSFQSRMASVTRDLETAGATASRICAKPCTSASSWAPISPTRTRRT